MPQPLADAAGMSAGCRMLEGAQASRRRRQGSHMWNCFVARSRQEAQVTPALAKTVPPGRLPSADPSTAMPKVVLATPPDWPAALRRSRQQWEVPRFLTRNILIDAWHRWHS